MKQMYDFHKIMFFINKFMSFCKIIGFTKQIYENKSLSPNHVFTFKISRFAIFHIFINNFEIVKRGKETQQTLWLKSF